MAKYAIGTKSYAEIAQEAKTQLAYALGVKSLPPYGNLDVQTSVFSNQVAQVYQSIETGFAAGYLSEAKGPWLDAIAKDYGIERSIVSVTTITKESQTFQLRTKDGTSLFSALGLTGRLSTIPRGLLITSSKTQFSSVAFSTIESTQMLYNSSAICFAAAAELNDGQIIPEEVFDTINLNGVPIFKDKDMSNIEFVQIKPIQGIERIESDDSLRYRISTRLTAQTGPNEAFITSLAAQKADIARVAIIKNTRGTGSADVILFPTRDRVPQSIISFVQNAVESAKSIGSNIMVRQPVYVPVSMAIRSNSSAGTIRSIIENMISDTNLRTITHKYIVNELQANGIVATVTRLTIDGRDRHTITMTSLNNVVLLPHEVFELKARLTSEPAIDVVS